jgi:hypothetical protein
VSRRPSGSIREVRVFAFAATFVEIQPCSTTDSAIYLIDSLDGSQARPSGYELPVSVARASV